MRQGIDPKTWDVVFGGSQSYTAPYMPYLIVGDVEKYGPRGTNEWAFQTEVEVPEQFIKGDLAETWEITMDKAVFHLRQGVMWTGNDHIGMEPREVTADDVVQALQRAITSPYGTASYYYVEDIYAEDKYTVVFEWTYNFGWVLWFDGMLAGIFPPEALAAEGGLADWRNQVGCGPFILDNYVEGTAATYLKDPNYTREKTTINGKEYQIPFIDKLVIPTVLDEASWVAALRTAKIDGDDGSICGVLITM